MYFRSKQAAVGRRTIHLHACLVTENGGEFDSRDHACAWVAQRKHGGSANANLNGHWAYISRLARRIFGRACA
jgi:hypothetical protein